MTHITWEQYHEMIKTIDRALQVKFGVDKKINVLGIPRGGLFISLMLSYMNPKLYEAQSADNGSLHFEEDEIVVLVDDVLETGATREHYNGFWANVPLAVLFDKSKLYNIELADVSLEVMDVKEWLQFPYEFETTEEIASMKLHGGYEIEGEK